jgi:glycosyltransferase involved in cell wall biosynthesis
MKTIQVPFSFAPDPIGGTEVFVANLARDLRGLGVNAIVAAPSDTSRTYWIEDLRVRRFAIGEVKEVAELYGEGDALAAAEFAKILDEEVPNLIHLHAFTAATSVRLVRAARSRGIPVVFTYHTPTVSCQRGTLLRWGEVICDGKLNVGRCAACTLNGAGMHRAVAELVGRLSPAVGDWLGDRGLQGGIWTALRMSELITLRHAAFHTLAGEVDHIVAVCEWVRNLLLLNKVPAGKVSISRQGTNWTAESNAAVTGAAAKATIEEVRLAFVGRLDSTKGLHVILNALRLAPTLRVRLDIYGVVQSSATAYQREMLALASRDPRVSFRGAIASPEVVPTLRQYDFLVVPSQWMETGPLVVLEAFAAGIPVIASKLGGIAEIARDGVDSLLVEPRAVASWTETLRGVVNDAGLRAKLKVGVRPPRTSAQVARDMSALYDALLTSRSMVLPEHDSYPEVLPLQRN